MNIIEIPVSRLNEYASIPIAFEVRTILEPALVQNGLSGIQFAERSVPFYMKDYDSLGSPLTWPMEFDISNWGIFLALDADAPVGGAALAWNTAGVDMLEDRRDLSVLWDIRVLPGLRGQGTGRALFEYAAAWSRARGCRQMKIETQNINVNACRFYAAMGAELGDIRRFAYHTQPALAHEVQLNWYFAL